MQGSKALSKSEITKVEAALKMPFFKNRERNLFMFQFCLFTGARINEPLELRVRDVLNPVSGEIQKSVYLKNTKNKRNHRLFFGKNFIPIIRDYIKGKRLDECLFPSQLNPKKPVSSNSILKAINAAMKRTGINGITSHSARKTFALTCRLNGMDLEKIRIAMNVSSVQVLSNHYFTASDWEVEKMVDLLNF